MNDQLSPEPLSVAAEEALFHRLLKRLVEAGDLASGSVSNAAESAAVGFRSAAEAVETAAKQTGELISAAVVSAAEQIQKHGLEALSSSFGLFDSSVSGPVTVAAAQKIVENRRNKDEPIAQVLFRVPEHLRDDVKRLALDEKRQMDELLTEAVLDLLLKHNRMPKAFQKTSDGT